MDSRTIARERQVLAAMLVLPGFAATLNSVVDRGHFEDELRARIFDLAQRLGRKYGWAVSIDPLYEHVSSDSGYDDQDLVPELNVLEQMVVDEAKSNAALVGLLSGAAQRRPYPHGFALHSAPAIRVDGAVADFACPFCGERRLRRSWYDLPLDERRIDLYCANGGCDVQTLAIVATDVRGEDGVRIRRSDSEALAQEEPVAPLFDGDLPEDQGELLVDALAKRNSRPIRSQAA